MTYPTSACKLLARTGHIGLPNPKDPESTTLPWDQKDNCNIWQTSLMITTGFFFFFAGFRVLVPERLVLLSLLAFNEFNLKISTPKKMKNNYKTMIDGLGNAISCWE